MVQGYRLRFGQCTRRLLLLRSTAGADLVYCRLLVSYQNCLSTLSTLSRRVLSEIFAAHPGLF